MNWVYLKDRLTQYYRLTRLNRPIGMFLLLWPMLWALWVVSDGKPDIGVLLVFLFGVVLMRSAGCVINDFADRDYDPYVLRTRQRPIAAGRVRPREALVVFAVLCLLAFALVLTMNRLTVYLSFVGVGLAAIYPFLKRYTYLPQVGLGLTFGWAVPMVDAAQTGGVSNTAWLIYVITVVWAVIYDTFYAMADREDDLKVGVKSTAILFGDADRVILAILQVVMLLGLVLLGQQAQLGLSYYLGLGGACVLGLYQQFLIRHRNRDACFRAFLNNNWLGGVVFAGIVIHYLLR